MKGKNDIFPKIRGQITVFSVPSHIFLTFLVEFQMFSILFLHSEEMKTLVVQSCPTLCSPMDCSPPGSSVHGISQARVWSALLCLLQGVFPTQGSNLHLLSLLHWQAGSLPLGPMCVCVCVCVSAQFSSVAQLCPTLCDPMDYTLHGILHARILEWITFHFFRGSSQPRDQTQVSRTAGRFFTS